MFKRRQIVEPPPEEYASGPTQTGKTRELIFDDLEALQKFCQVWGGVPQASPERAGDRYAQACYSPRVDIVALPSRKAWPSQKEIDQLREHEWAHARGWRHGGESLPPRPIIGAR